LFDKPAKEVTGKMAAEMWDMVKGARKEDQVLAKEECSRIKHAFGIMLPALKANLINNHHTVILSEMPDSPDSEDSPAQPSDAERKKNFERVLKKAQMNYH
jgi:hypothetical protein